MLDYNAHKGLAAPCNKEVQASLRRRMDDRAAKSAKREARGEFVSLVCTVLFLLFLGHMAVDCFLAWVQNGMPHVKPY